MTKARTPVSADKRQKIRVVVLDHGRGLPLPQQQTPGAAGLDLVAAIDPAHPLTLAPGARTLVPTGLIMEVPAGREAQVRPRSGLAMKNGITVLNAPGTIDSDYRGEVQVLLINLGQANFEIRRGDRIAQLVIASYDSVELVAVKAVSGTQRAAGGFGSTGVTPASGAPKSSARAKGERAGQKPTQGRASGRKPQSRATKAKN